MKVISSKDNKIIKEVASLSEKKHRDALGLYIIEGPSPIKEAFMQGGRPRFIFTRAGADSEEIAEIVSLSEESASAAYELTGDVFEKVTQTDTPQGVIAVFEKKVYGSDAFFDAVKESNVLVLDRIQDPGNLGTLLRTAEAMGFGGIVIIKGTTDVYAPKVVRAASGSILRIPLLFVNDARLAHKLLTEHGKKLYSAVMRSDIRLMDADLKKNAAVIIGNEGNGISEDFLEISDKIYIPMEGQTESLNAALAGAMIMYEALRQKVQEK